MHNIEKGPKQPKKIRVKLEKAWDTESEAELFIEALKKSGIYKENLLFSGFDGSNPPKRTGVIYCAAEDALTSGVGGEEENPIKYAQRYDKPAVAVYDENKVSGAESAYGKEFSDPSALLAVVYLE
jgi:hypothetical protein